jgi:hypothetical protein
LIVHILPLSKDPQPDEAEFNAFFPSKFSLSQFTSPESDLADADYPQPYRGSRRILVICTDERYLKMENGTLFSTGNHVDDQPDEKGRCFETGLAIRFNAQPCSALPRNLCSRDPGKLDSWIRDAVNSGWSLLSGSHASCTAILTPSTTPSSCRGATARRRANQPPEDKQACDVWQSWRRAA